MPQYVTVAEVAERLRYSAWYVRDLARSGRLPSVRLSPGGRLLFDPAAVEAALHASGGAAAAGPEPVVATA
jgi:excisionase family DNA binding protein